MIVAGDNAIAKGLLEESDESTVSLSDLESFEGETASSGYPNPKAKPFMPFQGNSMRAVGSNKKTISNLHPDFEPRASTWNVSQYPRMYAFLSSDGPGGDTYHRVALDCESKYTVIYGLLLFFIDEFSLIATFPMQWWA